MNEKTITGDSSPDPCGILLKIISFHGIAKEKVVELKLLLKNIHEMQERNPGIFLYDITGNDENGGLISTDFNNDVGILESSGLVDVLDDEGGVKITIMGLVFASKMKIPGHIDSCYSEIVLTNRAARSRSINSKVQSK